MAWVGLGGGLAMIRRRPQNWCLANRYKHIASRIQTTNPKLEEGGCNPGQLLEEMRHVGLTLLDGQAELLQRVQEETSWLPPAQSKCCHILKVPYMSILNPGIRIFSGNHPTAQGKRIRFLKRTMVEKHGKGINPQKRGICRAN